MTPAVPLLDGEPVETCSASREAPQRADPLPGLGSPQEPDPVHMVAREAWALLAPRIAGQPRMRVSRDRRSYPQRWEAALSAEPPRLPAAVRLYGRDGTARCLAADLDVSRGGAEQVAADAVALERLVAHCGGRSVTDRSPTDGRHVYVPLAEPVPFGEMRRAALALSRLLPSLDPTPLLNLTAGCIRPPAAHRSGGAQELITAMPEARLAAAAPNPPAVWAALLDALAPQRDAVDVADASGDAPAPEGSGAGPAGSGRGPSSRMTAIARTGVHTYPSGSEARLAVLTAAAGAGWALPDVIRHLETGAWPGLASFYVRYASRHRAAALGRDWRKATAHAARRRTGRNNHTSGPTPHPGQVTASSNAITTANDHQFVRAWRNAFAALEVARYGERGDGLGKRFLLRSLALAAHSTGSRWVEFGCRSLALAAGVDPTTVARHLRDLAAERDPFLHLVEARRGVRGDLYELVIPDEAAHTGRRAWPAGKVHGLRPAFRELGVPAALAYEQLERTDSPLSRFEVAARAGLSATATADALRTLAEHGLADRDRDGWRLGRASLRTQAEVLGVLEVLEAIRGRYAVERAAWRAKLAEWRQQHRPFRGRPRAGPARLSAPYPEEPQPDPPLTVLDVLADCLGAYVVEPE